MHRTSVVSSTLLRNLGLSSVFQIGDSVQITPQNWALAVQRQVEFFYGKEGNFEAYRIFTITLPHLPVTEQVLINRFNQSSFIKAKHIQITSVSGSSVYHIGSTQNIQAESRIKHIRQIERVREEL
ncbi:spore germination protein GerPE [Anaerobacillus alkaliphilus]|uniref:Spore germination protein GerPE n=1 Tax=Anaerobacillus alkaliphilus TaxID=1548597 RepID=A0A4Q0VPN7_9BACI|nr:spore germination protein GerPE [Anaerobacillus alkaliphilus]RXI98208.1 spore germination protein GerPE [Anaerobacillus alkaliphilus]